MTDFLLNELASFREPWKLDTKIFQDYLSYKQIVRPSNPVVLVG